MRIKRNIKRYFGADRGDAVLVLGLPLIRLGREAFMDILNMMMLIGSQRPDVTSLDSIPQLEVIRWLSKLMPCSTLTTTSCARIVSSLVELEKVASSEQLTQSNDAVIIVLIPFERSVSLSLVEGGI